VLPIKPVPWEEAKDFCRKVAEQMTREAPDRFTATIKKVARKNRIFIDYLRNSREATAIAPYSTRARPGATVSMPLNWPQVKAGLDPKAFTMRTAASLLKKSKPWADYDKSAVPLRAAIERLIKSKS
jgi:bifunctional non-homologous end joining protein LigD